MSLSIQLVFQGNCEEAFKIYEEVLSGKIVFKLRKEDDPMINVEGADKDKISHIILLKDNLMIGGNDIDPQEKIKVGNNSKLSLILATKEETENAFNRLASNGIVHFPLQKVHFSDLFGELTDKFGISWIVMMKSKNMG